MSEPTHDGGTQGRSRFKRGIGDTPPSPPPPSQPSIEDLDALKRRVEELEAAGQRRDNTIRRLVNTLERTIGRLDTKRIFEI